MSAVRWHRQDGRLFTETERGRVEIRFKERVDLGRRRYPYWIICRDKYGRLLDRTEAFVSLRETKELAEEFIARGLA